METTSLYKRRRGRKAEVFTSLIVDYAYVQQRANEDPVIRAKVEAMKALLRLFTDEMDVQFWARIEARRQTSHPVDP